MFHKTEKGKKPYQGIEIEDHLLTATEKEAAKMEKPLDKRPLSYFWFLIIMIILVLAGRAYYLNVVRGGHFSEVSRDNRVRQLVIHAPRGKIYDRAGNLLVNNIPSLDAVIIRSDVQEEQIEEITAFLSKFLSLEAEEIMAKIKAVNPKDSSPVLIKENISQDQALLMLEESHRLRGVNIIKNSVRHYVQGSALSHIIGYVGKINAQELEANKDYLMTDYIGKQGIEKSYEKELRGKRGVLKVEVDATGQIKREVGLIDPWPGNDLWLNLDNDLQQKIFEEMSLFLEKNSLRRGAVVALDPRTGGILSLVSFPSFDNNDFVQGFSDKKYRLLTQDPDYPLFNRVIAGEYPPASTIKPAIAAAGLSEKIIYPNSSVDCKGAVFIGSFRFGDWKTHGLTDVRKAIAESCDVFFYSLGGGLNGLNGLGVEKMKEYLDLFGFGSVSGIDLPGEKSGLNPSKEWKQKSLGEKWYSGDNLHLSIGQGFITATPLQLAVFTASLANGGIIYQPRLVNRIERINNDPEVFEPKVIHRNFIDPGVMKIVREGMRQTVTSGTARSLNDLPLAVAGKTGTAQIDGQKKVHSWFVSFAPFEDPELALVVLLEEVEEKQARSVAISRAIYQWYFSR